jgi:glutamate racemase
VNIGVFDSGVGGLSVLRAMRTLMPGVEMTYLADQANVPYGPRPLADIQTLTGRGAGWLVSRGCDVVVIACNTASAAALGHVRGAFPSVSFVGMEPAVKPAAIATKTGVIGVFATAATLKAERFASLVARFASHLKVIEQPCPEWVKCVEEGGACNAVKEKLWPVLEAGADTLVLGCTHFPFLQDQIDAAIKEFRIQNSEFRIHVIDPGPAVARQVMKVANPLLGRRGEEGDGQTEFFTTGDAARFAAQVKTLLGEEAFQRPGRYQWPGPLTVQQAIMQD